MKRWLLEQVPAARRLRGVSRLRWITKWRILRSYGLDPLQNLGFLLLDPEVESYSYDLSNEDELVDLVAAAFAVDQSLVRGHLEETRSDPELNERLRRHLRWRFDVKRRLPLGNRLLWYLIIRIRRPDVVIETGIYQGLGSLTVLRALERNALDGSDGQLVSVDMDPHAGFVVAERLRGRWTRLLGRSADVLGGVLSRSQAGVLFQDTPHTVENQRAEFGLALAHADVPLVLVDSSGGRCPVLSDLCEAAGVQRWHFVEQPAGHFYPSPGTAFAIFDVEATERAHAHLHGNVAP